MKLHISFVIALLIASCQGSKKNPSDNPPNVDRPVVPVDPDKGGTGGTNTECIPYKNGEELASSDSFLDRLGKVITDSNSDESKDALKAARNGEITCR